MSDTRVAIHTPESLVRDPRGLTGATLRDLAGSRALARRLCVHALHARYRQSLLGYAWAFLPPIAAALAFGLARDAGVIAVGETAIPYPAFVILSTALWQTFVAALTGPVAALGRSRAMLGRLSFPREALVLASVGEVLFDLGVRALLVAATFALFGIPLPAAAALAPLAVLALVLLGTLIGTVLAPFALLYHDVGKALTLATAGWFFLTPVVYSAPSEGAFATIVALNPVTPLLVGARELLTTGQLTDPLGLALVSLAAVALTVPALLVYRLSLPFIVERV